MKKSLLIVSHALELGGAERSLIGLLDALNPDEWDIDLFLLRHEGELLGAIPEYINLLPQVAAYTVLARPMVDTLKEGHLVLTSARLLGKVFAKVYEKKHKLTDSGVGLEYSHKFTCPFMPEINKNKEYDLAISFLTPHYFVAKKVRAKKKIAWIHTDYTHVQINVESERKMWGVYDKIASISDSATDAFLKVFPDFKDKVLLIENILPKSLIEKQAEEKVTDIKKAADEITLLSVGRFCLAKNFDNVPDMCAHLLRYGLNVKWYLIGYGGFESLIRQKIKENNMEKNVIILGKKTNPYPYIKECDIYVQPSRYEGKCVTVREAQMLKKPVVITRYATSNSQLEDGVDGIIVPMDNEGCAKGILEVIRNYKLQKSLVENCSKRDYSNSKEVNKLSLLV